jgi:hypothetical protein
MGSSVKSKWLNVIHSHSIQRKPQRPPVVKKPKAVQKLKAIGK